MPFALVNQILIFLINFLAIIIAYLVCKNNPKGRTNKTLVLMTLFMLLWVNLAYIPRLIGINKPGIALDLLKIAWFVTPMFFISLYFLVIYMVEKEDRYKILNYLVFFFGVIISFITGLTDLVVHSIRFVGPYMAINYGTFMVPFLSIISFIVISTIYVLFKEYYKADSTLKLKLQYFLIGISIFYILNFIFNIILPIFYDIIRYYWIADYSTIFLLGFTGYAIVKKELFGIKIVLTQVLVVVLAVTLFIQSLFAISVEWRIINILIFIFFIFFGIYLIKSVRTEEERARKAEAIASQEKKLREESEGLIKEFEKLSDAKNQFIMATQHHLRTPLTSMRGYLDLIEGGTYGKVPRKLEEVLKRFQASTVRLVRMVNEFLDISQFQLGKEVVYLRPGGKIDPILSEMQEELKFQADDKGIKLKIEKPKKPLPTINADIEKLKAAFFNIADNAIKYTQKGSVVISTEVLKSKLRVYIKDTGIGLSEEEQKTLFTKLFERGTEAKKAFSTGRGIGLYLSFQIVKAHKGKLWAESKGKGEGSTFIFELPIEK